MKKQLIITATGTALEINPIKKPEGFNWRIFDGLMCDWIKLADQYKEWEVAEALMKEYNIVGPMSEKWVELGCPLIWKDLLKEGDKHDFECDDKTMTATWL